MKAVALLLVACLAGTAQAAVYQWQDADGKTQYGDTPPADATPEPVTLPPLSTVPGQPAQGNAAAPGAAPATEGSVAAVPYTRMAITNPGDGQTIRTDTGRVDIRVELQPPLQQEAGHRLIASVDGKRIEGRGGSIAILAARGTHRAQVAVVDADGKVLARSGQVTFDIRPDKRLPISRELKAIQGVQPAN